MKRFVSEQVIVIAGGSSGIGRATARAAGERGAKVVVSARNAEALASAVAEIEARGGEALAVPADATSADDAERLCERAVERFGSDRHLRGHGDGDRVRRGRAARGGRAAPRHGRQLPRPVHAYRAALPHLRASGGTFIDVNSGLAYRGIPLQAAYCASKAAGRVYFEAARVEQERYRSGVDISLILPGGINTPQFDRARQKLGLQPQPVPPIYQPEVVAAAILHCA